MRAIIVDDEQDGIDTIAEIVQSYCDGVQIVGTANSPLAAIKKINQEKPDIIFLDIEMPHGNGFDVLEGTADRSYHVVFTTAYNHYAIRALKANAIDYLMKPVDIDELVEAVEKAKNVDRSQTQELNGNLLESIKNKKLERLPILNNSEYVFVTVEDIVYLKSDGSYCEIHLMDTKYVSSKSLKHFEELLSENKFLRINNSNLVNVNKIAKYARESGGMVQLENGIKIAVSKTKSKEVKSILGV